MTDIINTLKSLPKDILLLIIYELLRVDKITYHELTELHIQHLDELRKGTTENYQRLVGKIIGMWVDHKKNYGSNLKEIMHYLVDKGQVNETHERINAK